MGQKVIDIQFPIAGGKMVSLPVTDGGPIPTEESAFKIEVAGFSIQPSLFDPKHVVLAWKFGLTSKTSKKLERVLVEEVFPSDVAKTLVDDHSPSLSGKMWSGSNTGVEPNPTSTPWLFTEGASVFIFRFTITPAGGVNPVVLYQPAWFSRPVKGQFQQTIARINGS
jgi:hypothetical protein